MTFKDMWPFRENYRWGHSPLDSGECNGWHLECLAFDNMENHCAEHTHRIELSAQNEAQAAQEAWLLWERRKPYQGWNSQTYPRAPRVIYISKAEVER